MIGSDTPSEEWFGILTLGSDYEEEFSNYGRARHRLRPKAIGLDSDDVAGMDAPWIPGPAPALAPRADRR